MNKKGFTLVELLAVIAILAILVIIALPNVLKMFNGAKKNSFLTEAKTVYSEVSKKYISESMKGNKLTYISSEDDTKLEMTGRNLQYCTLLNNDGSVSSMKVSNGEWIAELPSGKKVTDLKSTDLKDGNLNDYDCAHPFKYDSWETISRAVKSGNIGNYHVGDEKEVKLEKYGTHTVRIANMSTPNECNNDKFSQSACGFVIEFVDTITTHNMNPSGEYKGTTYDYGWNKDGWLGSSMYKFLNDESDSNSIISALEEELKNVIKPTITVSGYGREDTDNFTSPIDNLDKLYLLAPVEVWNEKFSIDKANTSTRQLDYYKKYDVTTTNNNGKAKKKSGNSDAWWWLRSAISYSDGNFFTVAQNGTNGNSNARDKGGVSPAFRIG